MGVGASAVVPGVGVVDLAVGGWAAAAGEAAGAVAGDDESPECGGEGVGAAADVEDVPVRIGDDGAQGAGDGGVGEQVVEAVQVRDRGHGGDLVDRDRDLDLGRDADR